MKVRNGGGKEIPLIQGKEQWLCFAGAAVKRYPHIQGAVAAMMQKGREELLHVKVKAVRRYPSSMVRSSGCALLEQQ